MRTKLTGDVLWRIVRVLTPARGERVFELVPDSPYAWSAAGGRIYVNTSELDQGALAA